MPMFSDKRHCLIPTVSLDLCKQVRIYLIFKYLWCFLSFRGTDTLEKDEEGWAQVLCAPVRVDPAVSVGLDCWIVMCRIFSMCIWDDKRLRDTLASL